MIERAIPGMLERKLAENRKNTKIHNSFTFIDLCLVSKSYFSETALFKHYNCIVSRKSRFAKRSVGGDATRQTLFLHCKGNGGGYLRLPPYSLSYSNTSLLRTPLFSTPSTTQARASSFYFQTLLPNLRLVLHSNVSQESCLPSSLAP